MAFSSLKTRLGGLPQVLAGPMLRKVTPQSVTVWLALRSPATVTLSVETTDGGSVMSGKRHTVAIGTNLHLVAVTAQGGATMSEGVVYQYDLDFDFDDQSVGRMNLVGATANASLAYGSYKLPTFCLPPADPNLLRLICGSCRKASGDKKDHLALLDTLISQAVLSSNPLVRPQQLLLMGDQIYADDVAESLLTMLTDADQVLLGWLESIPGGPRGAFTAADRPAYTRYDLLDNNGFTSEDLRNHLMSLGEYLTMYLFAWSDVLWPATLDLMPSYGEIRQNVLDKYPNLPSNEIDLFALSNAKDEITEATASLGVLHQTLPQVRRALANIPTYMICDDHEVTDDWNMTIGFCRGVYGHPLGLRVVQNAMVAYSLCQHWGNAPEQFDPANASAPGTQLLALVDKGDASSYDANSSNTKSPSIPSLVSVHAAADIQKQTPYPGCFHDPVALDFHFSVEGPGHQIIFTDTRTWRSYPPTNADGQPDLLSPAQFQAQIHSTPSLRTSANADRVLLVVLTTNAPPTEALRAFTRHNWLANHTQRYPDIFESWEMLVPSYDRLLKALSDKLPPSGAQQHYGPVIILTGDVHHSFATRLVYQADIRYEDDPNNPQPTTAVFAQLVASSLKKQDDHTVDIHRKGYAYNPTHLQSFTPPHVPEGYVGWNVSSGSPALVIGTAHLPVKGGVTVPRDVTVDHDHPTIVFTPQIPDAPKGFVLHQKPHYRYRLEYLPQTDKAAQTTSFKPIDVPSISGAARDASIQYYRTAMDHLVGYHGDGSGGGEIVGRNNLCEVTFQWGAGDDKSVTHKVRWWYEAKTEVLLLEAGYTIKLDPNDFPDFTPAVQP